MSAFRAANADGSLTRGGLGLHWREFVLLLALVDAALAAVTLVATVVVWDAVWPSFTQTPLFGLWLVATWILWVVALRAAGAYDLLAPDVDRAHSSALVRAIAIVLAATAAAYFFVPFGFPRSISLGAPFPVLAVLFIWRSVLVSRLLNWSRLHRRILLLGIDDSTTQLAAVLVRERRVVPYEPVAFIADGEHLPDDVIGVPVIHGTEKLWDCVRELGVQEIAVGRWEGLQKHLQVELVESFYAGVAAGDAGKLYEDLTGRVLIGHVGPDWYANLPTLPRRPFFGFKRLVDVIGGLALLVLTLPVAAFVGLLVFLNDGPPIFYRQIRLGRRGVPFTVRKFRTMSRDAEPTGPQYAVRNDPRSTRLGTSLRRLGLDELPQLSDVVAGRMSLIGPRPERPEFVEQLATELPLYRARLLVRPGIVGWAEVHIPVSSTFQEHLARLEYDLYYIKHADLLLDINIGLRALGTVLSGRR